MQTTLVNPESRGGLTPEQRFFIGFVQWACESNRPEAMRVREAFDPHSPGKYHVNGVVVNMPGFGRRFRASLGRL